MNWQDFFKLTVHKSVRGREEVFFQAQIKTPTEFAFHQLIISRFDDFNFSETEKKKLSLGLRKIIVCHDLFQGSEFKKIAREFKDKIAKSSEKELTFSTDGGGIYLFIHLLKDLKLSDKKILCYTSEIPLPIMHWSSHPNIQFIYRPQEMSYLSDFSTLWKESDLMELFELKDFKASA